MSQENVEFVKGIQPPSGTDLTALYADDSGAVDRLEAVAPLFDAEFEYEAHGGVGERPKAGRASELRAASPGLDSS